MAFVFQPPLMRCTGTFGGHALAGDNRGRMEKFDQPVEGFFAVLQLRTILHGFDQQDAIFVDLLAGDCFQPGFDFLGSEGEFSTSKRKYIAVETLLTFCPPGPPDCALS